MGLDAVVYKNRQELPRHVTSNVHLHHVEETGEFFLEGQICPRSYFEACHKRLGNVSEISRLRAELEDLGIDSRWVIYQFVSSGSHSGDTVGATQIGILKSEIATIEDGSVELQQFLTALQDLAFTAQTQDNPIVFV